MQWLMGNLIPTSGDNCNTLMDIGSFRGNEMFFDYKRNSLLNQLVN